MATEHPTRRAAVASVPPGEPLAPSTSQVALPLLTVAGVESFLLHGYATGRIGWLQLLLAHVAVTGLLAAWTFLLSRNGRDIVMPLLTTLVVAAAGPAGAIAAFTLVWLAERGRHDPALLRDWYQRIAMAVDTDDVTRMCEQVMNGRTVDLTGRPPASFAGVMERGTLDDRQAVLGVIARNFHPDYLPVLMMALKSPEPMIRVQAAAVATRVRSDLHELVDRYATAADGLPATASSTVEAAGELEAAVASGLLDEGDRIRATVVAERLRAMTPRPARRSSLVAVPVIDRNAAETTLLNEGRFAELRTARRIAAIADIGLYRVRRARQRQPAREVA